MTRRHLTFLCEGDRLTGTIDEASNTTGLLLVSGGNDQTVRLWNVADRQVIATFRGHNDLVTAISASPADALVASAERSGFDVSEDLKELRKKLDALKESTYQNLTPMEQVQVARHPERPYTLDYIERIFTNWMELHGDRAFRDDEAIVGGWAALAGTPVMVIGHQKGRDMKENLRRNFGMAHPEGYRKALRLMRQAEKFGRAVVTFIDTPGAYPGT